MKVTGKLDLKAKLILGLVFVALGFMLSVQFKTTEMEKTIRVERVEDLSERLKQVESEKERLSRELDELKEEGGNSASKAEIDRLKMLAGLSDIVGKGVEIVLDDSKIQSKPGDSPNLYIIHDEDLLRVLNELRAAGAEAISVNDQRILAMSEVRCAGPTVLINNVRSTPPYVIKAIGNPKNLTSALRLRGGVVETFEFWGIHVKINDFDNILIPAFKGTQNYEFARPIEKEGE
ncbi:MAG: DUF881 domain-containing protein [Phascolarctobacterium sp.]|nr:DUF881 domain-containing protein [Phascolarctobacterium sp.]